MNRKKLFIALVILAIATLTAFNANIGINENGLSDVSLDNVEALANESGGQNCLPTRGLCVRNGMKADHISIAY